VTDDALALACDSKPAFLSTGLPRPVGTLRFSCWVRCAVEDAARIQISDGEDVASRFHPGDNRWHLLEVEKAMDRGGGVELYLHMLAPGAALFAAADCVAVTGTPAGAGEATAGASHRAPNP
jgi:hypothetical protein